MLIGLAVLGVAAIGAGFVVAFQDSNSGRADPAPSRASVTPITFSASGGADVSTTLNNATTPEPISATTLPTLPTLAVSTTVITASEIATNEIATTVVESVSATTAPTVTAAEVLTGPPSMHLPGGQAWPNGLYQDNIMYLRGTVPSDEVGGDLQRRAEEILGAENVRNELVIDPSVPKVDTVIVRLGNSVLFKSGDFDIPPESEPGFLLWAAFLSSNPSVTVTVIGHADSRGTPEMNQQLALQRSQVAAERITRNGIDLSRVSAVSRGADDPVAANDTQEGRALNRRVEFAVTGLLEA